MKGAVLLLFTETTQFSQYTRFAMKLEAIM